MRLRAEREKERQEYERAEKERKAAEEGQQKFDLFERVQSRYNTLKLISAARKAEEGQKKKDAMAALSASFGGYKSQGEKLYDVFQ